LKYRRYAIRYIDLTEVKMLITGWDPPIKLLKTELVQMEYEGFSVLTKLKKEINLIPCL
jgi:hypothetical protein